MAVTQPVSPLTDAVKVYRADAATLFAEAHHQLGPTAVSGDNAKLQSLYAAGLSQLATAEGMLSAQQNREGLVQVVALMTTTSTAADSICRKLVAVANQLTPASPELSDQLRIMGALSDALLALAQLAPTPVWRSGSANGGT